MLLRFHYPNGDIKEIAVPDGTRIEMFTAPELSIPIQQTNVNLEDLDFRDPRVAEHEIDSFFASQRVPSPLDIHHYTGTVLSTPLKKEKLPPPTEEEIKALRSKDYLFDT